MKTTYAHKTAVPVERSQMEIKKLLTNYGAEAFMFGEGQGNAVLAFELQGRRIRFILPLPQKPAEQDKQKFKDAYHQTCKSKWRALVLCIKAKLESVRSEITTLESEFMAQIVLPNGSTIEEVMTPQIQKAYELNEMPPMLGYGS